MNEDNDTVFPIPLFFISLGLYKFIKALVIFIIVSASGLKAQERELIAIFPVRIVYPFHGKEWLGQFLQEELSRQFQLQNNYTVLSPQSINRWFEIQELKENQKQILLKYLKPQALLELELQLVLNQLSVNGSFTLLRENIHVQKYKKIIPLDNPDTLLKQILEGLSRKESNQKNIYYPQGFSWKGIESFYLWKHYVPVPSVNSQGWKTRTEELETLLTDFPMLTERIHYEKAVILILEATVKMPAFVPTLNEAENELKQALSLNPENNDYHTLSSLIYYLRQEKQRAKAEAVIANSKNPRNGRALILYGLSIGRKAKDGDAYIKQGLMWYPMNRDKPSVHLDPYETLIPDLTPWLSGKESSETPKIEQLMVEGRELYLEKDWVKSRQIFENAWALEPELPEAPLYLARILIAEKDFKGALVRLNYLRKRFPENVATVLYLGYVYELLKKFGNAEILYRKSLEMGPENHRAMLRLSTLLIKTGKYEEAQSFLESLIRKYPDYTVGWWNLGLLYQKINELELAEEAFEEVVRIDPANNRVQAILEQVRADLYQNFSK